MDRVFKKVGEGIAVFDLIYDKMQASTNPSQKDKLEQVSPFSFFFFHLFFILKEESP